MPWLGSEIIVLTPEEAMELVGLVESLMVDLEAVETALANRKAYELFESLRQLARDRIGSVGE